MRPKSLCIIAPTQPATGGSPPANAPCLHPPQVFETLISLTNQTSYPAGSAGALPTCNNSIPPQIPATKTPPRKPPYFPGKNTKPPWNVELLTSITRSGKTGQKIAKHRKIPVQTGIMPQKCSTIHPQQFTCGPVISGTSRPHLVQIFSPKIRNNKNKKSRNASSSPVNIFTP
jgi:hypothetical protein